MKEQRKTEIKVGVTVIIGIIIFLWIFGWAKNISVRSSENFVKIKFKNVSGLEIGDPVTIKGLRKGYVNDIKIINNELIVEAAIDKDVLLYEDAKFSIVMLDLMGGKKIDIEPGISKIPIDSKNIYQGEFQADIPSVMALLGTVQDDLVFALKDIRIFLSSIKEVIGDDNFVNDLKKTLKNINETTTQINSLINQNKSEISQLTENTIKLTENTNNLIVENKESFKELLNNFKSLSNETKDLVQKLNSFTDEIKKSENNFGKILYDEELIGNLKNSIKQLDNLTKLLIEQLNSKGIKVDAHIF
ncbi:MAG: MlaD family protein [Ignavibacterium sp.]|nr:MlaD family protein [Ignavibacterium sp.]MDW8375229.1 MlaD family protein [Ignavibacteriales bacterium]